MRTWTWSKAKHDSRPAIAYEAVGDPGRKKSAPQIFLYAPWFWASSVVGIVGISVLLWLVAPGATSPPQRKLENGFYARVWPSPRRPSWHTVEHVFIFGDSWTTTGFDTEGPQPSRENPLGNPRYPGETAVNGPNWADYLTLTHNGTFVRTINLAAGGATVDKSLISPAVPPRDLKEQITQQFLPVYGEHPEFFDWQNETTLFALWIGMNDVHNALPESDFQATFHQFATVAEDLYQSGARNLVFLNVPPIGRSPLAEEEDQVEEWTTWVEQWNTNLTVLSSELANAHPDTTVAILDTFQIFDEVIDSPCTFPQTCQYQETMHYCPQYSFGTPEPDYHDPSCEFPANAYLWLNQLHPTSPMHDLLAQVITKIFR